MGQTAAGASAESCAKFIKIACWCHQQHVALEVCCELLLWGCSEEETSVLLTALEFYLCVWQQIEKEKKLKN